MKRLIEAFLHSTAAEFNFKLRYSQITGVPEDECLTTISDGIELASALNEAVLGNKTVKHFVFDGIPLWVGASNQIMCALMENSLGHIELLSFRNCMLDIGSVLEIVDFIRASTTITKVDLSFNKLSNPILIQALAGALQVNRSLKSLDLSGNDLSYSQSIEAIIYSPGLDKLWLREAHLKSDVLANIAENMERLSLSELYLENNDRISSSVLASFAKGLKDNKKLIALTLPKVCTQRGVPIEDIDADYAEALMVQNTQLVISTLLQGNRERIQARGSVGVVRRGILDNVAHDVSPVLASGGVDGRSSDLRRRAIPESASMLDRARSVRDTDVLDDEESAVVASSCWRDVLNCCKRQHLRRK